MSSTSSTAPMSVSASATSPATNSCCPMRTTASFTRAAEQDPVHRGRRDQQAGGQGGHQQGDDVGPALDVVDPAEPLGERQRQQEREQDLDAGLRDAQLLQHLDHVAVGPLQRAAPRAAVALPGRGRRRPVPRGARRRVPGRRAVAARPLADPLPGSAEPPLTAVGRGAGPSATDRAYRSAAAQFRPWRPGRGPGGGPRRTPRRSSRRTRRGRRGCGWTPAPRR